MDDLISRQAAISAICNACGKIDCDKMDKCEKLQLPPANCSEFPNNSDTISRQAAIDAINKAFERVFAWDGTSPLGDKVLENVPPAQPERIRGRWIEKPHVHGVAYCSLCEYELHTNDTNFCPNCGAKMDE